MRPKCFQIVSLLVLTTSVILASCGGGGSGSSPAPAASLAVKGTSGNAVNMNGTWDGGCTYDTTNQEKERNIATLNGGSATWVVSKWSGTANTNCTQTTTPDLLMNVTMTATLDSGPTSTAIWVDGSGVVSAPPAGVSAAAKATKATIVFNSATATLGSDAYVNGGNTNSVCGGGWVKNVPKNVLGCPTFIPSTTDTDYWVVDDSAAQLKWYTSSTGTAWQVDNVNPMVK
jgi:hypothetical protein